MKDVEYIKIDGNSESRLGIEKELYKEIIR
jgi:hypothetical protein